MKFNVFTIPPFDRQIKRMVKKYPSLKKEYATLIDTLEQKPTSGTSIGNNCYKIRMAIASKGKGKSGGARVVSYLQVKKNSVFLLSIYDKAELESISDKELASLLALIP
ncbi:MAG: type II toxin-antitoxin system RelE/ParE family toxin [Bacteroidetes bacterium]|nr:type II toxin-antitoxin system RelE/ParE family toxin [Bacteroidota bacterium]PIX32899.1 MAG: hypothetical protein COZ59_11555 [Bacteroidetes bacterium CG_4_8_14_3_um_filter_31_14]